MRIGKITVVNSLLCDDCEDGSRDKATYKVMRRNDMVFLYLCQTHAEELVALELPKNRFRMELDPYESHWVVRDEMGSVWLNTGDCSHDIFTKEQAEKLLELVREVTGED